MTTKDWFNENLKDQKRPLSSSSILDGCRCERLFFFRNRWAIRPKIKPYRKGASTGTLVHKLMKAGRDGVEKVQQEVIKQHSKLLDRIKAGEDLSGDLARAANELNHLYQKALAIATIFWTTFPPKKYMKTICREEKKESFAPNGTVPCVWIADWIVEDTRDGGIWIRDTKTTSETLDAILTGFLYSVPCRFYRIMAAQEEWGDRLKGFILDTIQVPTIKLCGKDEKQAAKLGCTPFEAYVQRVKEWYKAQDEDPMKSPAIVFNEDIHNPEIIKALADAIELQERDADPKLFSRDVTGSRCYHYRKVCPYYALCSTGIDGWPSLIERYYEIREEPKQEEKK